VLQAVQVDSCTTVKGVCNDCAGKLVQPVVYVVMQEPGIGSPSTFTIYMCAFFNTSPLLLLLLLLVLLQASAVASPFPTRL